MRRLVILFVDLLIIYGSIILSFLILGNGFLLNYPTNINAFYYISPIIAAIYLVLAYIFGLMDLQRRDPGQMVYPAFIVSAFLTVSIMASIYFIREGASSFPRSVILLSSTFYFISLAIWRESLTKLSDRWHGCRDAMIVGCQPHELIRRLETKYAHLYNLRYVCNPNENELLEKAATVSEIFISDDVAAAIRNDLFVLGLRHPDKNVHYVPRIQDVLIIQSRMNRLDDIPTHMFGKMFLNDEERFVKRAMDIIISVFVLGVFSPLFVLIAILIKLDGGPIFYTQERLTRGGKRFRIVKFRTMVPNAETISGPILTSVDDERITRLGRFLRSSRLDESPQFWNILVGEMSVVGPRPERPYFAEHIEKDVPEFRYRLNVKAGLTGMAQLMGKYNTDFKQKLQYDLYYINNFSVFRDILYILQTITILFRKESVEGVRGDQHNGVERSDQPIERKIESKDVVRFPLPID